MLASNDNNKADSGVCRKGLLHFQQHVRGMEYQYEIWIENKGIETPHYKKGTKHTLHFGDYDEADKTGYDFYCDYCHGNPTVVGNKYQHKYDKTMARKAILERNVIKVIEMWERDWNARNEALPDWIRKGLEKLSSLRCMRVRGFKGSQH